jgi:peptidoglycan-N-acetylglucosamine deacetylase
MIYQHRFVIIYVFISSLFFTTTVAQKQMAITMDDPHTYQTPIMTWQERNTTILATLNQYKIKAALFVCGMRVDDANGRELLNTWDSKQHSICNHSYSHLYYNGKSKYGYKYVADFMRGDSVINQYKNYTKLYRYPYLKEGNTLHKRDTMRKVLSKQGYSNGHVSIDASDWYIDAKLVDTLQLNPTADVTPYKMYYIQHIIARANYYDSLALLVWKAPVKHTLLIHHSLLNALFLGDVLNALQQHGWTFINAKEAFTDPIYNQLPNVLPAGESIIYQLASTHKKHKKKLRYPAEDGEYEAIPLNTFLKQ